MSELLANAPTTIKTDAPAPVVNEGADWAADPVVTSSGELPLRRSGRSNKGVGPSRLGFEEGYRRLDSGQAPRTLLFKNFILLIVGILGVFSATTTNAVHVTVCNCRKPQYGGIMSFAKLINCPLTPPPFRPKAVQYERSCCDDSEGRTFHEFACRTWQKVKTVKEGILFNTNTTFHKHHKLTPPGECWTIKTTGKCGDGNMVKSGSVWSYHAETEGEGSWNSVSEFKTLNCEWKEVTLEHACADCPVHSITGETASSIEAGSSIQGQRTYVWAEVGATKKPCDLRRLKRRPGLIFTKNGTRTRLRDVAHQIDFPIGTRTKFCDTSLPEGYTINRKKGMAVLRYGQQAENTATRSGNTTKGKRRKSRRRRALKSPVDCALSLQQYLPGHFDYITDVKTDQENRLADAINSGRLPRRER